MKLKICLLVLVFALAVNTQRLGSTGNLEEQIQAPPGFRRRYVDSVDEEQAQGPPALRRRNVELVDKERVQAPSARRRRYVDSFDEEQAQRMF